MNAQCSPSVTLLRGQPVVTVGQQQCVHVDRAVDAGGMHFDRRGSLVGHVRLADVERLRAEQPDVPRPPQDLLERAFVGLHQLRRVGRGERSTVAERS